MININVNEVADYLSLGLKEFASFYDTKSNEVTYVQEECLICLEDEAIEEALDLWDEHEVKLAQLILKSPKTYLRLPTSFDIDDYSIMNAYCLIQDDKTLREKLLDSISGRGAFSRFRNTLDRDGDTDNWYRFRNYEYSKIVLAWCEENNYPFDKSTIPTFENSSVSTPAKPVVVNSINKFCPRSGKPIQDDSLSTYKGLTVGFCNTGCRDDFAANKTDRPKDTIYFDALIAEHQLSSNG